MKKRGKIIYLRLICFSLFLLMGCKTFDTTLLQASDKTIVPKIVRLSFESRSEQTLAVRPANTLDTNSYMYTVFRRELPNFIEQRGDEKGRISIEIIDATITHNWTWAVLSGLFLLIPNIVGMPWDSYYTRLEFEVTIYNLKNEIVWNKAYSGRSRSFYDNIFGAYSGDDGGATLMIELFKNKLNELKQDLQIEVNEINNILNH